MLQQAFDFGELGPEWPLHEQPVFFGLRAPAAISHQVNRVTRDLLCRLGKDADEVAAERRHISLHTIGDYRSLPRRRLHAAHWLADSAVLDEFSITFDKVTTFRRRRDGKWPIVMNGANTDLTAFHQTLVDRLKGDRSGARRQFAPHMTVIYSPEPIAQQPIAPISFRATEFVLIRSIQGRGEHRLLGRWPLRAQ